MVHDHDTGARCTGLRGRLSAGDRLNLIRVIPAKGGGNAVSNQVGDEPAGKTGRSRGFVDYERVANLYLRGRALSTDILDKWGAVVVSRLPDPTSRVLDVGAGTGIFASAWPSWTSASVVAVEPAKAMTNAAVSDGVRVPFVRGVAEALPFPNGRLDVVWVSAALHHFSDLGRAVDEFGRVLRPGGRALVRTHLPGRTEVTFADEFPGRYKWTRRFQTEEELRQLFGKAEFDTVDVTDVLEWEEPYSASADWVVMMRNADSILTALSDDDIAAGLDALRSQPDQIGRLEVTLLTFERA